MPRMGQTEILEMKDTTNQMKNTSEIIINTQDQAEEPRPGPRNNIYRHIQRKVFMNMNKKFFRNSRICSRDQT